MDVSPIIKVFDGPLAAGAAVGLTATAFSVMLAGYQYMSVGGSVRAVESAKGSLYNALIGLAVVIMSKIIAGCWVEERRWPARRRVSAGGPASVSCGDVSNRRSRSGRARRGCRRGHAPPASRQPFAICR
jgi:hypothetical protein